MTAEPLVITQHQKIREARVGSTSNTGSSRIEAVAVQVSMSTTAEDEPLGIATTVFAEDWESEADSVFDSLLDDDADISKG